MYYIALFPILLGIPTISAGGSRIAKITGELCDVDNNKRHYDTFKTVKQECPITYEEKLNYYSAVIEYHDLNDWLRTVTSKWLLEQVDLLVLQAKFEKENEGFYGVKILNAK